MLFKESGNCSHREPLGSKGGGNRLSQDYAFPFEERARVFAATSVNRQARVQQLYVEKGDRRVTNVCPEIV